MPLATQEPGNPLAREAINDVARGSWVLFVVGLVSTVAGGLILVTDWSVDDLALFLGTLLVGRGVLTMLSRPLDGSAGAWSIAMGVLEAGLGIALSARWCSPGYSSSPPDPRVDRAGDRAVEHRRCDVMRRLEPRVGPRVRRPGLRRHP